MVFESLQIVDLISCFEKWTDDLSGILYQHWTDGREFSGFSGPLQAFRGADIGTQQGPAE